MEILITDIKGLVQVREMIDSWVAGKAMAALPILPDAYLHISQGTINDLGPMHQMPSFQADLSISAKDRFVFPSFVDSHTHLVYATSREGEFVDKIKGLSYQEIARKGGGILNSARRLQHTSEEQLFESALIRAKEIMRYGTAAVEIKSGYGLTTKDELKMLRVARRIGRETSLTVRTTFLGAHAIPTNYKDRKDYIRLVTEEMIPAVAEEGLADYIDVFCEKGFFNADESEEIAEEGKKYGLRPKIHANQLSISGGVQVGVKTNAISVDHLESVGEEELLALCGTETMPTLLPGAAFYLNMSYPPARDMIDRGLPVALATDYNPGSAPCGRMALIISLACIKMKMIPEEAINAATINGAYAMGLSDSHGRIAKGLPANLFITTPMPSVAYFPYAFGSQLVDKVILKGELWEHAAK